MPTARSISKNPRSGMTRLQMHAKNNLGVIMGDKASSSQVYRNDFLALLDSYYDNCQYDDLMDWEDATKSGREDYVPIRSRKPRIIYNVAKVVADKVAAKLVGSTTFPKFVIEDDDDDTAFFRVVQKAAKFRRSLIEPIKHLLVSGSVFVRYYLINGTVQMEYALSKYCYPTFDAVGELDSIEIKYVFEDAKDLDAKGNPKKKWYRLVLGKLADVLSDTPEYRPGVKPTFVDVDTAEHGLGWVQGEWFVTHKDKFDHDGRGLCADVLGFIDELNYSLSQSSQASSYGQEPQLTINKMDEDELEELVRSSEKAWNLGRDGEASYLETDMKGVEGATKLREDNKNRMLDVIRVILHDPEKMAVGAQSGEALKQLNAPLVELVDDLRAVIEPSLVNLLIKIALTTLHYNNLGEETIIETPAGYMPASLDITVQWPPIFPPTIDDIQKIATAANTLATAQVVSRETLTRWVAPVMNIENVEEELQKIATQPVINPFGSF